MGLYVSHISTLPADQTRELYVYLLDYGWPDGEYEQIFRDHFQSMSKRASETRSIVIASHRGIHFANEVLSFHRVFDLDPDEILPAVLITKTHPSYFVETYGPEEHPIADPSTDTLCRNDVVLIPLRSACTSPADFASLVESIFADLSGGLDLQNFRVSKHDKHHSKPDAGRKSQGLASRFGRAIVLEPNFAGFGINLKELIGQDEK